MNRHRRAPRGLTGALLGAAAGFLFVLPAHAYVRTTTETGKQMYWRSPCISVSALTASPPANLIAGQMQHAVQGAADAWNTATMGPEGASRCTALAINVTSRDDAEALVEFHSKPADRKNLIMFRHKTWCREPRDVGEPCYDNNALAITSVFADKKTGQIYEADMEINAVIYSWADVVQGGKPAVNAQDLQNALTHEMGHLIGLDHTCSLAGNRPGVLDHAGQPIPDCVKAVGAVRETTMFAAVIRGDTTRRTLAPDDSLAVCSVYAPTAEPVICDSDVGDSESTGGCAIAAGHIPRGQGFAPFALLSLGLALAGVRRLLRRG